MSGSNEEPDMHPNHTELAHQHRSELLAEAAANRRVTRRSGRRILRRALAA